MYQAGPHLLPVGRRLRLLVISIMFDDIVNLVDDMISRHLCHYCCVGVVVGVGDYVEETT